MAASLASHLTTTTVAAAAAAAMAADTSQQQHCHPTHQHLPLLHQPPPPPLPLHPMVRAQLQQLQPATHHGSGQAMAARVHAQQAMQLLPVSTPACVPAAPSVPSLVLAKAWMAAAASMGTAAAAA